VDFDFGTIVFFAAFLWFLFSEMRPKKKKAPQPPGRRTLDVPPRRPETTSDRAAAPPYDAELERRRLERLLKGLDPDGGPLVVSLESAPARVERAESSYDDRAEAASRARIEAARARDRALTDADHAAFDRRVRAGGAATNRKPRRRVSMGDAIIWREILGPPVSLRDDPE
jgi:hypothetical protein